MRIVNRKAKHQYHILEEVEAGIALSGAEVKSLREGRGSIEEAFGRIKGGEAWLYHFMIPPYRHADVRGYEPTRPRKLLLHKKEILALSHKMAGKNLTLVPLVCYTTGRFVKIRLGLGKGKKQYEKRELKKKREAEREIARTLKRKVK
jgi:SsrA-binding protein